VKYRYQSGEMVYEVLVEGHGDGYRVTINGARYEVDVLDAQGGAFTLRLSGEGGRCIRESFYWGADGDAKWISCGGCTYRLERPLERRRSGTSTAAAENSLRAPMPAQVRAVQVGDGEEVAAGQTLLLLEAMKMEIKLASPRAGKVARIMAKEGQTVERDQILVELE
jgi:acetyl/propionyl-CoA carboxylase alpha subunit